MNWEELLNFIEPQTDDLLQMVFFGLICLMICFTVATVYLRANSNSWERKWSRESTNNNKNGLGVEHGSVTDLWHAVATAPEKLAEIMPGMLLVVGLLGTFLGLGLALNHASNILGQSNALDAGGIANSMEQLLGLLQGLGTKFKTSTWGITGFLLFKIWSGLTGFDEKRLSWVIGKVQAELEKREEQQNVGELAKQESLFGKIDCASDRIVDGFAQHIALLMQHNKELRQDSQSHLDGYFKIIRDDLQLVHADSSRLITKSVNDFRQQFENNNAEIRALINEGVMGIRQDLNHAHSVTRISIGEGIEKFREDLAQIQIANQTSILENVKGVREDLGHIYIEARATRDAMDQFTGGTQQIVEKMAGTAERMAGGAGKVGGAAEKLVGAIDAFKSQFTDVLDNVRRDLGTAIHDMSSQASETLERGSEQLGDATREISSALGVLSADVKETMSKIDMSINAALKIQEESNRQFTLSSDSLNENIIETTSIVSKLCKPIEDGLQSVANSGQQMRGIGNTLKTSIQHMEEVISQLSSLSVALDPLKSLSSEHSRLISTLTPLGELQANQQSVLQEVKEFREQLKSPNSAVNEVSIKLSELLRSLESLKSISNEQRVLNSVLKPFAKNG